MKKIIIGIVLLGVIALMFRTKSEDTPKYTITDLQTKEIFSEKLDPSKKHSYENKALYLLLENDLRGLNNLRTQDFLILFKYSSKEIHFIPITEGKTNSDKREKFKMLSGGPIETALAYTLESPEGTKTVLFIESELHKERCYVVRHIFEDQNNNYCKRGILVEI